MKFSLPRIRARRDEVEMPRLNHARQPTPERPLARHSRPTARHGSPAAAPSARALSPEGVPLGTWLIATVTICALGVLALLASPLNSVPAPADPQSDFAGVSRLSEDDVLAQAFFDNPEQGLLSNAMNRAAWELLDDDGQEEFIEQLAAREQNRGDENEPVASGADQDDASESRGYGGTSEASRSLSTRGSAQDGNGETGNSQSDGTIDTSDADGVPTVAGPAAPGSVTPSIPAELEPADPDSPATPDPTPTPDPEPAPAPDPEPAPEPAPAPEPDPEPAPEPEPAPAPAPSPGCNAAIPGGPTLFGSMISTRDLSASAAVAKVDRAFGRVPVVRVFDPGLPSSWNGGQFSAVRGRTLITSFAPPISEVLSGRHDAALRKWFAAAPTNQTIYWSYMHEPDAKNVPQSDYKAAWRRIAGLADEACKPNMIPTLILTSWTADPSSGANRTLANFDPGKDVVDVIAWDPYNGAGSNEYYDYKSPEVIFGQVVAASQADGRPWGIAETGVEVEPQGGPAGRVNWLTESGNYLKARNPLFVSYFNSNKEDGNWELHDAPAQQAWGAFVR